VKPIRERIIVAIDTPDAEEALRLARALKGHATHLKVGSTLFLAAGPAIVGRLRGLGFEVFVDLKLHDIPHQVAGAVRELTRLGASMVTVHASGGSAMLAAAVDAARRDASDLGAPRPLVVAVTVLTSLDGAALAEIGVPARPLEQVAMLARLAQAQGCDGVVCSPQETAEVRRLLGPDAVIVTPGVRPAWAAAGDQARVATPSEALTWGATFLVVGRPVTDADDPAAAFDRIVAEVTTMRYPSTRG
jgi:orotidine-5'-phosphate decarboxylase